MEFTPEQIDRLSALACLSLSAEEQETFALELEQFAARLDVLLEEPVWAAEREGR